ncbi:hypothetical protein JCM10212_004509 [Sporobolomyces blumeae]
MAAGTALRFIHYTGTFALFAAMALLIVASVSSPVWNTVGYLKGEIQGASVTFGNWGFCLSGQCTSGKLGYPANFITGLTGANQRIASETVLRNLTYTLILTPIAAGLSFIAFLLAIGTHLVLGILGSIAALLAFIVTIVALGLQLGLFIVTRNRINGLNQPNTHVGISSCIWLVVAAAGCQLWATITVCLTRSRRKRDRREDDFASVPAMSSTHRYSEAGAPSTVGSTGPLVHDTTGVNTGYNTTSGYNNNTGYTGTSNEYVPPVGTQGVAGETDANGHFWHRKDHTAI